MITALAEAEAKEQKKTPALYQELLNSDPEFIVLYRLPHSAFVQFLPAYKTVVDKHIKNLPKELLVFSEIKFEDSRKNLEAIRQILQ